MRNLINKYLSILIIIIFPLGQLSAIPLPIESVRIYYHDLLIILLLLNNLKCIPKLVLKFTPLVGFIFVGIFSLLLKSGTLPSWQLILSSLYLLRLVTYLIFILLYSNLTTYKQTRPYLYFAIFTSTLMGLIQYFYFPLLESLFILGWDRHAYRLVGAHLDPNFTGLILTLGLLWVIHDQIRQAQAVSAHLNTHTAVAVAAITSSLAAILLTYSRSTFIALALSAPIILKKHLQPLALLLVTGIILTLIYLLPVQFGEGTKLLRTSTITARILNWQQGLQLFASAPLFGYGYNTLQYLNSNVNHNTEWFVANNHSKSGLDNSILLLLVTVGIMGTLQFFWFGVKLLKKSQSKTLLLTSLAAIFVHSLFQNSLLYPWTLIWIAIITVKT